MPIYLQIPNITGESKSSAFPNQFQLMSFAWGLTNTLKGKPNFGALTVMKSAVSHSPSLMLACAQGTSVGTVVMTITVNSAVGKEVVLAVYTLSNAYIQSYQQTGADGSGPPSESLSLGYSKIEYKLNSISNTGSITVNDDRFWDIAKGVGG